MSRWRALAYICFAIIIISTSAAHAVNKTWTAAVSGNFSDAARWTGGVPTSADTATFAVGGTYTVTFTSSPTNQDLFFQGGTVTFRSSGGPHTYLLNGGGEDAVITGGSLTLGTSAATALNLNVQDDLLIRGNASLTAQFGSVASQDLTVGDAGVSAGDGTVIIDGSGSSLTVKGISLLGRSGHTGTLTVRNGATADFGGTLGLADSTSALSTGVFNVESGASVTTANIRIGPNNANGQSGTFNVGDGVGTSTVTQDNNATLVVGATAGPGPTPNVGRLNVNAGGVFNSGGGTGTVTVNPTGRIDVAGTLNLNGNTTVDGGIVHRSGSGVINLAAGRTFTAQNNASIRLFDAPLSGGTTWQFNSGTSVLSSTKLDVGLAGGTTTVIFDRASLSLTAFDASHLSTFGADGNTADVTFRNGASTQLNSLHLGASDKAGTSGTLTVTGTNSRFSQGSNRALVVGHAAGGTGTINVTAGGSFTGGISTVNRNGRININDGGTFRSFGNFTLNGGRLDVVGAEALDRLFNLDSGRTMTIQNGGQATFGSVFYSGINTTINVTGNASQLTTTSGAGVFVEDGSQMNVTAGGDVMSAGRTEVGSFGTGALVVDGAGSTFNSTSNTPSIWAAENVNGSSANVTLRNGASASLPGGVHLGLGLSDSDGVFNIESGAAATLGPLVLNQSFMNGASATVNVGGQGSTLNATSLALGNGTLIGDRGSSSGGSATVNVTDIAFLNVGAGGTMLKSTGTINITDGNVNLGALTDNGGIINFNSGTLSYIGNLVIEDDGMLADGDLTLNDNHHLNLSGTTTIDPSSALILDGGTLITGALAANGRFVFNRGQLVLNQAGTSVNAPVVTNTPSTTIVANANNISLGDASSFTGFHHLGVLDVGANTVTLNSAGYARLGVLTTINGGTINAPNGIYLAGGADVFGRGTVNARITGDTGGVIQATGPFTLGDAASPAGFNFAGELRTRQHNVTLNSSSQAALGNLTTLGSGASPGTLNAANGFVVDFGEAVTGFGTINSNNTLAKRAIINGNVQGNSAAQPITLTGYVKGVGSFDNVVFTGLFDPGLSPTIITGGSMSFGATNTLRMELGGTARGSQYDAIISSGTLGLDGMLQVELINGFAPSAGDSFDILDWATLTGTFDTLNLPLLAGGLTWDTSQLYTTGVLGVITAGLPGDYNNNGAVDAADFVMWRKNLGSVTSLPNDDTAGVGPDDYNRWRANFGRTAGSGSAGASPSLAPPPEPVASILLLAAFSGVSLARRSRHYAS